MAKKNEAVPKINKLMIWPSRKINLGNYSTVDLNAGVEIVFDTPVNFDSPEVKTALNEARKLIREEWAEQYKPYQKKPTEGGDTK